MRAAFSTDEWACSEQTTTPASGRSVRAAASAARVDVDAVSSMCPCHPAGSPSSWASHPAATYSSSVETGEACQRIATVFSAAARNSARMAGSDELVAKYAKKRGWFQCVIAGRSTSSRSRSTFANGSGSSGGAVGRRPVSSPGSTCASTGRSPTRSR